ncbi:MAG TPA: DUF502 domain-containing protein [Burkholderiales bacterium]|nr:DUF502 domain-containing protein [Burkholderiales bacterium]
MIKRSYESIVSTWLAGLLALLPLALTATVLVWAFTLVNRFVGPGSLIGRLFAAIGDPLSDHPGLAYLFGTLVLIAAIYVLGLVVQLGLKGPLKRLADLTLRRIPLVGSLYNLADRFVGLLDQKEEADIRAMSSVWCFFGGKGAAVLALAPSAAPVDIDGRSYLAVLIPTAPVPFGGALLYVPAEWVRPANIGVDKLTAIYVSMGITPPPALTPRSR